MPEHNDQPKQDQITTSNFSNAQPQDHPLQFKVQEEGAMSSPLISANLQAHAFINITTLLGQ